MSTSFVRWETSGDVSVSDPNSETTKVTVKGSGTLNAIYESDQADPPSVGGRLMPVNRLAVLAPYLALLGVIAVAVVIASCRKPESRKFVRDSVASIV